MDNASPASDQRITIDIDDGVAEVTLNRPEKLNALDPAMFKAIIAAGERLSSDSGLRAVVLTGAGRGFCAGLDKETFAAIAAGGAAPTSAGLAKRTHGLANDFQHAAHVWRTLPVPVIAAIHGPALGGGFQIALGALMRELARSDVIRELSLTGRVFSGAEALAYGFASGLHADPLAAARATAREIAARSPDAVRALKRLLNLASDADTAAILLAESNEQAKLIGSPDQVEAVRAGIEGRPGRFADEG